MLDDSRPECDLYYYGPLSKIVRGKGGGACLSNNFSGQNKQFYFSIPLTYSLQAGAKSRNQGPPFIKNFSFLFSPRHLLHRAVNTLPLGSGRIVLCHQPDNGLGTILGIPPRLVEAREGRFQQSWSDGIEANPAASRLAVFLFLCGSLVLVHLHVRGHAVHAHLAEPVRRVSGHALLVVERVGDAAEAGGDVDDFWLGGTLQELRESTGHDRDGGEVDVEHAVARFAKGRQREVRDDLNDAGVVDEDYLWSVCLFDRTRFHWCDL